MKHAEQALLARPRLFPADTTLKYIAARFTERTAMRVDCKKYVAEVTTHLSDDSSQSRRSSSSRS